jgi:hypothetical protein
LKEGQKEALKAKRAERAKKANLKLEQHMKH